MTTEEKKKTPYLDRYTDNLTEKVSKKAEAVSYTHLDVYKRQQMGNP